MSGGRDASGGWTRRSILATGGALALGAASGCIRRARNVMARDPASQVSLRILAAPADSNPIPLGIARELAGNLQACGVDAEVVPMSPEALYRDVLLNQDFDIYVGQFSRPDWVEPDHLYALLYSAYASEPGWQNPFGYTDLQLDEDLEIQRTTTGGDRLRAVETVQRTVAESQPFAIVGFPDALGTVRMDRFRNWRGNLADPLVLLGVDRAPGSDASTLRVATTDGRITKNRNPLVAEFRTRGTFVDLLYDSLGRRITREFEPWLAERWQFSDPDSDGRLEATVRLRDGLTWHDGERLTAGDVAFTYRFLADTSMGTADSPIPASRYRGRVSLVDEVTVLDDHALRIAFGDVSSIVARRAFSVPILPAHVWRDRTDIARIAGRETDRTMTTALASNNASTVGSGPLEFEEAVVSESVRLSRFDDHFLVDGAEKLPGWVSGGPVYDEFSVTVAGTDDSIVELVASGDADATVSPLGSGVVPRIGRESALTLHSVPSRAFYHVGYNVREAPLSNVRFRRIVSQLLDKSYLVGEVFDGYARPAASPLDGTGWVEPDLKWNGTDPATPFLGTDGDLDESTARDAFLDAGYRYDDGRLLKE